MKTVFILGAGSSVEAGAPLMRDFVQKAKLLKSQGAYGIHAPEIQDVLDAAFENLRSVHAKSSIEYEFLSASQRLDAAPAPDISNCDLSLCDIDITDSSYPAIAWIGRPTPTPGRHG